MILLSTLLTLCLTIRLGDGVGFHGFHFRGLEEPQSTLFSADNVQEKWITQPLDHFNARDNRTWSMRYYLNSAFFKKNGPILIMIGGEWEINKGFLTAGQMFEIGRTHNAMMYYTEHRYYGKSKPTLDITSANLQYLSVDQALADLAYFIECKKRDPRFQNSKVIVFGGSYAGSMATWARLKYPHLIYGALASSAPVYAKADFYEYYEVVTESLRKHSQKCVDDTKAAFDEVEKLLSTKRGAETLKSSLNLCSAPNIDSPSDLSYFMNFLAETFGGIVQYNSVVNGKSEIAACCSSMTSQNLGTPLQRLARLVSGQDKCLDLNYEMFVKYYANSEYNDVMRQWYYQTCSEYGYFQTTNSTKSIFGTLFPVNFYTTMCTDLYGSYYNKNFLNQRIRRTNIMYGGLKPDLRNVIFTNGDVDPWHALSVLRDLNKFSPAILIKGSSHCQDLYTDSDTSNKNLVNARENVRKLIGEWITSK
ncbi:putative serine protease K12H4.7 [Hylaeus volcanicus]|uniref:putative serine protease K12H4.7 n=1 Tax=Hylaeus volcanicus TaxID=313075 RepID=UPI0023B83589|nr:putative serine protease K12H4.7 [Hylaeus volcanicus]